MFWSYIDVIVVRVKVSRGIVPFCPMGIDSADTGQPPNGEIMLTSKLESQLVKIAKQFNFKSKYGSHLQLSIFGATKIWVRLRVKMSENTQNRKTPMPHEK